MFRELLLGALVVSALGGALDIDYAKCNRDVRQAKKLLDDRIVEPNGSFEFVDKPLHYLVVVGTVYEAAHFSFVNDNPIDAKLLLKVVNRGVPNILENSDQVAEGLDRLTRRTLYKLSPLLKEIERICEDDDGTPMSDTECNLLVKAFLEFNPALDELVPVLNVAGKTARNYLDVEKRLNEVAGDYGELPYLLDNVKYAVSIATLLRELMRSVFNSNDMM